MRSNYSANFITALVAFLNNSAATAPARIAGIKMTLTAINNVTADLIKEGQIGERETASGDIYWVATR